MSAEQDKTCTRCGQSKPRSEFHRRTASKDGLAPNCKPCVAEVGRLWREANTERKRETARRHYEENADAIKAKAKKWREENAPRARAAEKAWRERNPDRCREYTQRYRERHPDTARRIGREQGRRRTVGRDEEAYEYAGILRGDPCSYCGALTEQIDHIQAVSEGGSNSWENLTAACRRCNGRKQAKGLLHFMLEEAI